MKKLLIFIGIVFVLLAGAVTALVTIVDPNQLKPLLVEQTKQATGLDLVIDGDIQWQFFPTIGFQVRNVTLKNPAGFRREDLLQVSHLSMDVAVLPLLDQQVHIGRVSLDGANFYIETRKDGQSNLDSLLQKKNLGATTQAGTQPVKSSSSKPDNVTASGTDGASSKMSQPWQLTVAGVEISHANMMVFNAQTDQRLALRDINLLIQAFEPEQWTEISWSLSGEQQAQIFSLRGEGEFRLSADYQTYALRKWTIDGKYQDPTRKIEQFSLKLPTFDLGQDSPLSYSLQGKMDEKSFDLKGQMNLNVARNYQQITLHAFETQATLRGDSLPQNPLVLTLKSDVNMNLSDNHLQMTALELQANDIHLKGQTSVNLKAKPYLRFQLQGDQVDLDPFFPSEVKASATNKTAQAKMSSAPASGETAVSGEKMTTEKNASAGKPSSVEPDLSVLKTFDMDGTLEIAMLKANHVVFNHVMMQTAVHDGVATLSKLKAGLYQGKIDANARLDARQAPATYRVVASVDDVQIHPLLMAVANNNLLEGDGSIKANLTGQGLSESRLKQNIKGTVVLQLTDGALNGINIAQMIRQGYAKLKGQTLTDEAVVQKTDFSSFEATFQLNQGIARTDDLSMKSPLLRIGGQGQANYIQQTVDAVVRTSVVGTLKGQGGQRLDELKGVTIPLKVKGSWQHPRYQLVFDEVVKQKAKKELNRGLKKLENKIKDEKTKQAVDQLLKGLIH
jgi:AsmA protein